MPAFKEANQAADATKNLTKKKSADEEEEKEESNCMFIVFICVIVVLTIIGIIDSLTTKYFKRMCVALATWTMDRAPLSFFVFEFVIFVFVVTCIPYGPLSVLSGALFYQKYKKTGIVIAFLALLLVTFLGGCVAFYLARHYFKETVQKKIKKSSKLKFLISLDKLIEAGQGLEMVVLIRVAPLPNGPTNYFLGTTALQWKDFIVGSILVGMPECLLDVAVGAGAQEVDFSNPKSVIIFVVCVLVFMAFICYIGSRAKHMLDELEKKEAEKAKDGADEELVSE